MMKLSPAFTVLFTSFTALAVIYNPACAAESEAEHSELKLTRDYTPLDRKGDDRIVSYADVLDPVTPAVVSISTARVQEANPQRDAMEEALRRYFGLPPRSGEEPSAPQSDEPVPSGLGSGFIVSDDGYILTNNHVVRGMDDSVPDEITVKLRDGREFDAELIGADRETDVAVLKIEAEDLPSLSLGDNSKLRVGDIVFAIGNPLGIGLTVTQGIVSAKERTDLDILPGGYESFIQTDAAINRGNSGGPLVDGRGRVVGINSAIISNFAGGNIGLGFAIPVDLAANVAESLASEGEVKRGFIGIVPGPLTRDLAKVFGLDSTKGAVVNRVTPGLPAEEAGVLHGDIILKVNGTQVDSVNDLIYLISRLPPESIADLAILRRGEEESIKVKLGDRAALISQAFGEQAPVNESILDGVIMEPVTPTLRADYDLPEDVDGLLVTEIDADSPYLRTLQPGTVIIEINQQNVNTLDEANEAIKPEGGLQSVYLYFDGNHRYTALNIKE